MENIRTSIEAAAEETRTAAQNNSDTDDWTFVSPPPSNSSSPTSGRPRIGEAAKSNGKDQSSSSLRKNSLEVLAPLAAVPPISTPRIDFSLADEQQQSQNEDDASVDGDDADDESDGMTEINLSDESNAAKYKTESKGSGSAAKRIKFASPLCSSKEDTDEASTMFQLVYDRLTSSSSNSSTTPNGPSTNDHSNSTSSSSSSSSSSTSSSSSSSSSESATLLSTTTTTQTEVDIITTQTKPLTRTQGTLANQQLQPDTSVGSIFRHFLACCFIAWSFFIAVQSPTEPIRWNPFNFIKRAPHHNDLNARLQKILESSNRTFNFVYLDPSNHAYTELKLLDEEIVDCIRRENPNLEEIKQWLSPSDKQPQDYITQSGGPNAAKPFKGLVCYENEVEWRKRFNKLKTEYHIDLGKILKRVRQQLTYEMLELHHPSLRFKLIINQLEYLNFVDQRRKDRALERLKAENFELSRRPTSAPATVQDANNDNNNNISNKAYQQTPNQQRHHSHHHYQHQQARLTSNSLVSLESENRRLRRENEALKASLTEKAGTIYIKQSIELERCERENNALRQFHHQVAEEVSKGSKQLNLHITDFSAILNGGGGQGAHTGEQENNFITLPLAQTRAYLIRLVEEVGVLVNKNKNLQDELRETRLLNALVVREAKSLIGEEDEGEEMEDEQMEEMNAIHAATLSLGGAGGVITDAMESEIIPDEKANVSSGGGGGGGNLAEQQHYQYLTPMSSKSNEPQREQEARDSCLTNRQVEDFKMNWLMKRAKLREQLRRSANKIVDSDPLLHNNQIISIATKHLRKQRPSNKSPSEVNIDNDHHHYRKQQKPAHKHQMMNKQHDQDFIYERRKAYHKQGKNAHNYQPNARVEL